MIEKLPDQDMLEEMRNGCWDPWTLSQAWNNYTSSVLLKNTRFLPYLCASWEDVISYSFLVNCELPPAFKKHIFLSCEIEYIPTLFQEMSLSSHSNSLHPGHPLSPELSFLIAPCHPCTLAVDLTFPREPITLSSTFNHPDKFRYLLSQSFLF